MLDRLSFEMLVQYDLPYRNEFCLVLAALLMFWIAIHASGMAIAVVLFLAIGEMFLLRLLHVAEFAAARPRPITWIGMWIMLLMIASGLGILRRAYKENSLDY